VISGGEARSQRKGLPEKRRSNRIKNMEIFSEKLFKELEKAGVKYLEKIGSKKKKG